MHEHGDYANGDNNGQQHGGMGDDDRKIFVGGLSWETGDADIKDFFSSFGEVESVNLKTDPNTGRSRGFAFVVFSAPDSVEAVLNAGELVIGKKKVEAKRAKARSGKVFVGGIPPEVSDEEIKSHFGAFGKISEIETPFDKIRNQRKGFVFITFENEAAMKELLNNPKQVIGGKEVDVKKATPRPDQFGFSRGGMRGAPRGGMGMMGGRGGRGGGFGAPARGGGPAGGGRGGWGWGGQSQQWGGGYSGGYDAYGSGGYGGSASGYGGGQGYGYGGYGDGGYGGYGASSGTSTAAASGSASGYGGTAAAGRGGGSRYTPY